MFHYVSIPFPGCIICTMLIKVENITTFSTPHDDHDYDYKAAFTKPKLSKKKIASASSHC